MELISHRFPKKEVLLLPVGDIQWAGDESEIALGMLKRHIQWGVKHDAYFLGMGDYIDTFSPSNRARLTGAALYDTAMKSLDRDATKRVKELYDLALKPSKGRWLGLLEGHHYHEYRDRTTSDQYLASLLNAPFLGTSAYIRLAFERDASATPHVNTVLIWCHHGTGSSSTAGGALNRLERMVKGYQADIFIMGHHHTKDGKPQDMLVPVYPPRGAPYLAHRTRLLVVSGSFLKGVIPGRRDGAVPRGGYVEQGMLNPAALGAPLVKIRPRWDYRNGTAIWLPDLGVEL